MASLGQTSPTTNRTPSFAIELVNNNNNDDEDDDEKTNSLDDLVNDEEMRVCLTEEFRWKITSTFFFCFSVIMSKRMNFVEYRSLLNDTIRKMIMIPIVNNHLSIRRLLNNVNV